MCSVCISSLCMVSAECGYLFPSQISQLDSPQWLSSRRPWRDNRNIQDDKTIRVQYKWSDSCWGGSQGEVEAQHMISSLRHSHLLYKYPVTRLQEDHMPTSIKYKMSCIAPYRRLKLWINFNLSLSIFTFISKKTKSIFVLIIKN